MAPGPKAKLSKRAALGGLTALAVQLAVAPPAVGATRWASACVDPVKLSDAEIQLRESLNYADPAKDPAKACKGCEFFKAQDRSACGACEILSGPTSPTGHCDSWAARTGA